MESIISWVILVLLAIYTLRDIIALSGWIKFDWKYSWIFYGNYDKELLKKSLSELGFDKLESNIISKEIRHTARRYTFDKKVVENPDEKLVELLSKYIIKFNEKIFYGNDTPTESNYYISTMEASHDKESLDIMCELIQELILSDCKADKIPRIPDFILTPKGGNPLLGYTYSYRQECIGIFRKSGSEKSTAKIVKEDYEKNLMTNFEGSWKLIKKEKEFSDRKLYGVVIDCNLSGGSQIVALIDEFNETIEKLNLNAEKVVNAYSLFRVDSDGVDVDKRFRGKGYYIHRYFDLNEEMKKKLYSLKGKKEKLDFYNRDDQKKISDFIKILKEKELYKTKIDYCEDCTNKQKI